MGQAGRLGMLAITGEEITIVAKTVDLGLLCLFFVGDFLSRWHLERDKNGAFQAKQEQVRWSFQLNRES